MLVPESLNLIDTLLGCGRLTPAQASLACQEQHRFGGWIGYTLVACGFISPEALHATIADGIQKELGGTRGD